MRYLLNTDFLELIRHFEAEKMLCIVGGNRHHAWGGRKEVQRRIAKDKIFQRCER